MKYKNKSAFTIFELLLVIAITMILAGGLFSLINNLVKNRVEKHSIIKNEAQLNFIIDNLSKLLATAGFGIERENLDFGKSIDITDSGKKLKILTRAATENVSAGCWGIIDSKGNFNLKVDATNDIIQKSFTTYRECPTDANSYPIKISILDKSSPCSRNCMAFFNIETSTVEVYTNNNNMPNTCLAGTSKLMLKMNNSSSSLISCVGDLRFRYIYLTSNKETAVSDSPPNYDSLIGIRMCAIVQISDISSYSKEYQPEPQYSERCGGKRLTELNTDLTKWEDRKWIVLERDIYMPNLSR